MGRRSSVDLRKTEQYCYHFQWFLNYRIFEFSQHVEHKGGL
jgi:hypothetical protein